MSEIVKLKIGDIDQFKNHPYKVQSDESLIQLQESIKTNGLLNPIIVRKKDNGRYEMISGHRRMKAMELNGETEIDAYIKELSDDEATIFMVDSNLQREKILPSEKAFAYKMKYDVLKRKAGRRKCSQVDYLTGKKSVEVISEECGDSPKQVQRYLKLGLLRQIGIYRKCDKKAKTVYWEKKIKKRIKSWF